MLKNSVFVFYSALPFFLFGCGHLATRSPQALDQDAITLVVTIDRHNELETCGCSLVPMGGLQREWNAESLILSTYEGAPLPVSAGTTFVPSPDGFRADQLDRYATKAMVLAAAMKELGTKVVALSAEDLALGVERLSKLQAASEAAFVTGNLVAHGDGKPVFPTHLEVQTPKARIWITGISTAARSEYKVGPQFEVREPLTALKALLAGKNAPDFLVILSNLPEKDRTALSAAIDLPTLWVGSVEEQGWVNASQLRPQTLLASPFDLGRSLFAVNLAPVAGMVAFDSRTVLESQAATRRVLSREIATLQASLKKKLSREDRVETKVRLAEAEAKLAKRAHLITQTTPNAVQVRLKEFYLGGEFEKPENPMTGLVAKYKASVREVALQEDKSP